MELNKIQLLEDELEVTNEIMLKCDLVGILIKDDYKVNVIKNRMNNLQGLIPGSLWDSLVDDYEETKSKADKDIQEPEDNTEEEALNEVNDIFNEYLAEITSKPEVKKAVLKLNDLFVNITKEVEQTGTSLKEIIEPQGLKIKDAIKSFENRDRLQSFMDSIETTQETATVTEITTAQRTNLEKRKAQLDLMLDNARILNISTKSFEKKVRKQTSLILQMLG